MAVRNLQRRKQLLQKKAAPAKRQQQRKQLRRRKNKLSVISSMAGELNFSSLFFDYISIKSRFVAIKKWIGITY